MDRPRPVSRRYVVRHCQSRFLCPLIRSMLTIDTKTPPSKEWRENIASKLIFSADHPTPWFITKRQRVCDRGNIAQGTGGSDHRCCPRNRDYLLHHGQAPPRIRRNDLKSGPGEFNPAKTEPIPPAASD